MYAIAQKYRFRFTPPAGRWLTVEDQDQFESLRLVLSYNKPRREHVIQQQVSIPSRYLVVSLISNHCPDSHRSTSLCDCSQRSVPGQVSRHSLAVHTLTQINN